MGLFTTMALCAVGTTVTVGLAKAARDLFKSRKDRTNESWTWKEKLKAHAWNTVYTPVEIGKQLWTATTAVLWFNGPRRGIWFKRVLCTLLIGIIAWFKPVALATAAVFYACMGLYFSFHAWEYNYHYYYNNVVDSAWKAERAAEAVARAAKADAEAVHQTATDPLNPEVIPEGSSV